MRFGKLLQCVLYPRVAESNLVFQRQTVVLAEHA